MQEIRRRIGYLLLFFIALAAIAAIRLFYLQVICFPFFKAKLDDQLIRMVTLIAPRGDILSRDGSLLATSINSYSVFVNPREMTDEVKNQTAAKLAPMLEMSVSDIRGKLNEDRYFVWLKRQQSKELWEKIDGMKMKGVYSFIEKKRVYPKGTLAAGIVGFVGRDNDGLAGLELSAQKYLKGKEGKYLVEIDPSGREIVSSKERIIEKPQDGMNITLTIDETIQHKAEQVIAATAKKFSANFAMVLVMDPKTGELLAMASTPQLDPNNFDKYPLKDWQSRPVSWVYEPGSTFKCITVASAVDAGKVHRDSKITFLSKIVVGGKVIENSHHVTRWGEGAQYTVSEMLQQSFNTGAVQVGLKLGKDLFYKYIRAFGFGNYVDLGLPGESRGIVNPPDRWYAPDIGMITFGQSIAVTPVQLLAALSAIGNKGELLKPILIKKIASADEETVISHAKTVLGHPISEKAAAETTLIMEDVTYKGTGHRGAVDGFLVASKTGTAQKIVEGGVGYLKGHYVASYFAFAPASDPKVSMLIIVDDPKGSIWGESTAGPVFGELGDFVLRYLNAKPDAL